MSEQTNIIPTPDLLRRTNAASTDLWRESMTFANRADAEKFNGGHWVIVRRDPIHTVDTDNWVQLPLSRDLRKSDLKSGDRVQLDQRGEIIHLLCEHYGEVFTVLGFEIPQS